MNIKKVIIFIKKFTMQISFDLLVIQKKKLHQRYYK
jgi:hypothetical protein